MLWPRAFHWLTDRGVRVSASPHPETIHDFGGFNPALYDIQYSVPGDPELAQRIVTLLRDASWPAQTDPVRGLDHGAWVPLLHLLPAAQVPVVQVSLPAELDGEQAWELGRALAPLSHDGALVIGSGSLTHNLHGVFQGTDDSDYAMAFTQWIREAVLAGDADRLKLALSLTPHAERAHPTAEHFWPLIVAAAAGRLQPAKVLEGGMACRVLSMDAFVFGDLPGDNV